MKGQTTNAKREVTLTPTIFNILVVLTGGERHGYAILREVEELAGGRAKLGATTLYRSIRAMLDAGLIDELGERPDPDADDERRRYYRLTDLGARVLSDEAARLETLLKVVKKNNLVMDAHRATAV